MQQQQDVRWLRKEELSVQSAEPNLVLDAALVRFPSQLHPKDQTKHYALSVTWKLARSRKMYLSSLTYLKKIQDWRK